MSYKTAPICFSIRGTREFVYVLFELQFKGDNKRRFYRLTIGAFQQCFDEFMTPQTGMTAFSCVVSKDENSANHRAQRITEYLIQNGKERALEVMVKEAYGLLVELETEEEVAKRRFWREPGRKPRL